MRRRAGRVVLVGAGPGDPGLLTLRAATLIGTADVIVHDGLLGPGIERMLPREARVVRLRSGPRTHPVRSTVRLLASHARKRRLVVRLFVGDPLLFGTGAEEFEGLRDRGIAAEVVPGVSSATAAMSARGLRLQALGCEDGIATLPGRHADLDWDHAAAFRGNLVVLMGASRMREITATLVASGRPRGTAAAVVERATLPEARVLQGTLGTIAEKARRARVRSPAILLVGPRKARR